MSGSSKRKRILAWLSSSKPLNPHDAFFGGHPNASYLYYKVEQVSKSGMWTTLPSTHGSIRMECIPSAIVTSSMNLAPRISPSTLVWLCAPSSWRRICFTLSCLTAVEESSLSCYVAPVWSETLSHLYTKNPFCAITPRMNGR